MRFSRALPLFAVVLALTFNDELAKRVFGAPLSFGEPLTDRELDDCIVRALQRSLDHLLRARHVGVAGSKPGADPRGMHSPCAAVVRAHSSLIGGRRSLLLGPRSKIGARGAAASSARGARRSRENLARLVVGFLEP